MLCKGAGERGCTVGKEAALGVNSAPLPDTCRTKGCTCLVLDLVWTSPEQMKTHLTTALKARPQLPCPIGFLLTSQFGLTATTEGTRYPGSGLGELGGFNLFGGLQLTGPEILNGISLQPCFPVSA